jgi:peptidoglycan-N-acetylglucosamine deacetylase
MIRNPVPWPNGARCAAAITFDMDADSSLHLNHPDTADTKLCATTMMRYDADVAMPRLIEVFKRFGLRQTFFVPGWCVERYSDAIKAAVDDGHEIAHHGYLHEKVNLLSDAQELQVLRLGIEAIRNATGRRPRGYRAPSYAFSKRTLSYLLDEGFEYDSSLLGSDIPYLIANDKGSVVEVPIDTTMDDWTQFMCFRELGYMLPIASPARAMEVFRAEFDAAWKYGGMWMAVWHPFVSGRLARCDAMIGLIEYMLDRGGVWFATTEEIAAHVRKCIADGLWTPRTDILPLYRSPIAELRLISEHAAAE